MNEIQLIFEVIGLRWRMWLHRGRPTPEIHIRPHFDEHGFPMQTRTRCAWI
jgi:hypothetical protein